MSELKPSYDAGDLTLSAVDFLRLADERVVCRVDLAEVGRSGILYVRELTSAEKTAVLPRPKGKARMYKDQSMEIDWSQLAPDAVAKFLRVALLTGDKLAGFFDDEDTATIPADQLHPMYDQLVIQCEGKPHLAMEALERIPNVVANLLVKKIRAISGLDDEDDDDDVEDAKKN